ncbi:MAG: ATP-binding protein [Desulforhopalus sp.]|nr:ATP-binding protein [Desulforhopalus sp.]
MVSEWLAGRKVYAPSWMIIGISLVLMAVVIFMGVANYNREKIHMGVILREKGAALIWSFEAGAQAGMAGVFGSDARLQTLLEKTASRHDISYIALVDRNGVILAHNDKKMIGKSVEAFAVNDSFAPKDALQWRTVAGKDQQRLFEVFKNFLPTTHHEETMEEVRTEHEMSCSREWLKDIPEDRILDMTHRPTVIVGMDIQPFDEVMVKDIRNSLISAGLVFLLALGGVISLFWAQTYLNSRKLLQDIRAFASEIVRNLPVGILVVSKDNKIRYINSVACSLLAVRPETAEGAPARSILPIIVLELRTSISREKSVVEKELNLTGPESTRIPVNVSTTNIVGEDGQYIGYMFVLKDLSELRLLELKIRQREKLAAIGDLAAGIAHEVRNPLSSIKGYVTYSGSLFPKDSENRRTAEITAEEVDRVNRVISELLEFARPSDLKLKTTDIVKLIEHATGIVAQEAAFAGVTMVKQFGHNPPPVMIDPDRITQVILNLLINAVQAMEKGGQLTVETRRENESIVIDISDTGPGISPKDQSNVFNPYFTTKKKGTGLGLAIVHKIVEDHGGSIRIHSEEGHGTRVSMRLPFHPHQET